MSICKRIAGRSFALAAWTITVSLSAFTGMAVAKPAPTSCGAVDILGNAAKSEPEKYRKIKAAATAVLNGEGLLWRIEKAGLQPSYLFGTMHSTDPRLNRQFERIRPLITASKAVAVEISELVTPGKKEAAALEIAKAGIARSGNALEGIHPPANRFIVETALQERGLSRERAERLETWFLIVALSSPTCERQRRALGLISVDEKIGLVGSKTGKTVIGLEKLEDQIAVLRRIGGWNPSIALIETAKSIGLIANMRETLTQAYIGDRLGEISALSRISDILSGKATNTEPSSFVKSLLDDRNLVMRDNALPLLKKGGAFIAVGALHLPTEVGLVNLLRKEGYRLNVVK